MSSYQVPQVLEFAKEALCDRDPSVMGASLSLFEELAEVLFPFFFVAHAFTFPKGSTIF